MRVAGFGFRAAATQSSLRDAYERAACGMTPALLAAPADKAAAPVLMALAEQLALPLMGISPTDLSDVETLTHTPAVLAARGVGSVAEAAALAAARKARPGTAVRLLGPRIVSADRMATCAVALVDDKGVEGDCP